MAILYEYLCDTCKYNFEILQSIKDDALVICPECLHETLNRVLYAVPIITKGEAVTIAQQADRNVSKMGRYELEAKREAGKKEKRPKPERPFWRKTDKVDTELAKLAPNVTIEKGKITKSEPLSQKAVDYIMTGKK